MHRPSKRLQHVLAATATPIALVAAGAMVYQASYAAFSGQTRNSGNEWSTGSVNLTDDDSGAARFQVANMVPGQTDTQCIRVSANASVPSTVKGYAVNPVNSPQGLEDRIKLTIRSGNGGSFANCAGFIAEGAPLVNGLTLRQMSLANTYESGMGGWSVPGGAPATRTYEVSYRFDTTGMPQEAIDQLQGAKTGIDIQWEMRSDS